MEGCTLLTAFVSKHLVDEVQSAVAEAKSESFLRKPERELSQFGL